ncbi:MAG TPA: dihydrofolate reductase family protein [Solirubrobacteraceae bacterium]|jgi:riboflavin biosynthesis pyrimidine reductase
MGERHGNGGAGEGSSELLLERLLPPSAPATVAEIVSGFGLWERSEIPAARPRVMLNMVATADGRATLAGRSGPISGRADRQLFHGLRAAVDGVLVGAGTVRAERYGRMIPDGDRRRLRRDHGLSDEPLACIVSGRLALGDHLPLLAEPEARVALVTSSQASLPASGAQLDYVRAGHDGVLDLAAALAELRSRLDIASLLCEGGPHLARQLLGDGLVDELFLSISPRLVGGEPAGGEALRILAGAELDPPAELELLGVLSSESYLFLRYGVSA